MERCRASLAGLLLSEILWYDVWISQGSLGGENAVIQVCCLTSPDRAWLEPIWACPLKGRAPVSSLAGDLSQAAGLAAVCALMEWTWILLSTGGASCERKTAVCCFNRYEWADRQSPPFSALAVKIDRSLRIWGSPERRGGRVVSVMVWPRRRVLQDTPGVTHNRRVASHESVIHTWHDTTPCYCSATGTLSLFGPWDSGAWWMTPRKPADPLISSCSG